MLGMVGAMRAMPTSAGLADLADVGRPGAEPETIEFLVPAPTHVDARALSAVFLRPEHPDAPPPTRELEMLEVVAMAPPNRGSRGNWCRRGSRRYVVQPVMVARKGSGQCFRVEALVAAPVAPGTGLGGLKYLGSVTSGEGERYQCFRGTSL
jgi:hypothetical protein